MGNGEMNTMPHATTQRRNEDHIRTVAARARTKAVLQPVLGGRTPSKLLRHYCTDDHLTGARLIASREAGYHTGGWWKNPDYERCLHLSLSFRVPWSGTPRSADRGEVERWVRAFFNPDELRLLWHEGPHSPDGVAMGVQHFRLFFEPDWNTLLLPRGEVYTRDWTPAGWKSFSDLFGFEPRRAGLAPPPTSRPADEPTSGAPLGRP